MNKKKCPGCQQELVIGTLRISHCAEVVKIKCLHCNNCNALVFNKEQYIQIKHIEFITHQPIKLHYYTPDGKLVRYKGVLNYKKKKKNDKHKSIILPYNSILEKKPKRSMINYSGYNPAPYGSISNPYHGGGVSPR